MLWLTKHEMSGVKIELLHYFSLGERWTCSVQNKQCNVVSSLSAVPFLQFYKPRKRPTSSCLIYRYHMFHSKWARLVIAAKRRDICHQKLEKTFVCEALIFTLCAWNGDNVPVTALVKLLNSTSVASTANKSSSSGFKKKRRLLAMTIIIEADFPYK